MKQYIEDLEEFNEARKWKTSGLPITLKQIRNLPAYKNLITFGFQDISSSMQKKRLNFRFKIIQYSYHQSTKHGDFVRATTMHIDVNQRSGRIQAYWINHSDGHPYSSGGHHLKTLNKPIETLEEYTIMFNHVLRYIQKKMGDINNKFFTTFTEEELENLRIQNAISSQIKSIW